jgi:hypothetical protein
MENSLTSWASPLRWMRMVGSEELVTLMPYVTVWLSGTGSSARRRKSRFAPLHGDGQRPIDLSLIPGATESIPRDTDGRWVVGDVFGPGLRGSIWSETSSMEAITPASMSAQATHVSNGRVVGDLLGGRRIRETLPLDKARWCRLRDSDPDPLSEHAEAKLVEVDDAAAARGLSVDLHANRGSARRGMADDGSLTVAGHGICH